MTVDGEVALVGSSNLDLRSFDLNYESNLLLSDAALTAAIAARPGRRDANTTPPTPAIFMKPRLL